MKTTTIRRWIAAFFTLAILCLAAGVALAAETAAPAAGASADAAPAWQSLLINILYAAGAAFTLFLTWIAKLLKGRIKANETQAAAVDAVTEAVARTYVDYVRDLKERGKFDAQAKVEARDRAIALAKELAKNDAVREAVVAAGSGLVEKIVNKFKAESKAAK